MWPTATASVVLHFSLLVLGSVAARPLESSLEGAVQPVNHGHAQTAAPIEKLPPIVENSGGPDEAAREQTFAESEGAISQGELDGEDDSQIHPQLQAILALRAAVDSAHIDIEKVLRSIHELKVIGLGEYDIGPAITGGVGGKGGDGPIGGNGGIGQGPTINSKTELEFGIISGGTGGRGGDGTKVGGNGGIGLAPVIKVSHKQGRIPAVRQQLGLGTILEYDWIACDNIDNWEDGNPPAALSFSTMWPWTQSKPQQQSAPAPPPVVRHIAGGTGGTGGKGKDGGGGGVGQGVRLNMTDIHEFSDIRGGHGGTGGEGINRGGDGGLGEAPKLNHRILKLPATVHIPSLSTQEFCKKYRLNQAIEKRLEDEGYDSVGGLLELSEHDLLDMGCKRGQIAEIKRALREYLASLKIVELA
ncbi:hypothetical protein MIND_00871200 [Mycena indigotica]|uniref:SAM domain-containing protein n=1 Tax=Mycena indigotica TaxID=2126181 RepID=A0A8H6SGL4_9AGAR|nr:uncharacterized protein MIND_00871200 [Mycena indigotica]KAF7299225.1 hypothetical protein MIND_00871200 [Mycena indigotica]